MTSPLGTASNLVMENKGNLWKYSYSISEKCGDYKLVQKERRESLRADEALMTCGLERYMYVIPWFPKLKNVRANCHQYCRWEVEYIEIVVVVK